MQDARKTADDHSPVEGESSDLSLSGVLVSELRGQSRTDREAFTAIYDELRRIARTKMRFERPDHPLQPTALVNEVFIKVFKSSPTGPASGEIQMERCA